MTMGGLYLLSGLDIAGFIRKEKYVKAKLGIVWSSIFSEINLCAIIIRFLFK